jgi:preprotein translocase subunit SecA
MERLGMEEDVPIEHRIITRSIENAQIKVEGHNFDIRKHVVQYDDVMNKHREVIYADRKEIVAGEDMQERVWGMVEAEIEINVDEHLGDGRDAEADYPAMLEAHRTLVPMSGLRLEDIEGLDREALLEIFDLDAEQGYRQVEAQFGPEIMRKVERHVMLAVIDKLWVEHLTAMDELREGVGLQAYGQQDPLVVYKTQGFKYFQQLLDNIQHDVAYAMFRVQPVTAQQPVRTQLTEEAANPSSGGGDGRNGATKQRKSRKVGVNDPCPCGSGKKYKHCHGAAQKTLV